MKKKKAIKNKRISKVKKKVNNGSNKVTRLSIKKKPERVSKEEGILNKIDRFFKEAKAEIVKVKWPSQKELIAGTIAVIIISLVFAFFWLVLGHVFFGFTDSFWYFF